MTAKKKPNPTKTRKPRVKKVTPKEITGFSKVIKSYGDAIVKVKEETLLALKKLGIIK